MIGWLRGKVVRRDPARGVAIVEAQGVGWELHVSIQTLAGIPGEGEAVELWVHTNVREDAIQLFGFASEREKQLFRMLTSVPKVGPRNAVAVLGGFPVRELVECIAAGESAKLVKIPGIGKKTAEQIVLTLGDKVVTLLELMRVESGAAPVQAELPSADAGELGVAARDVLLSLGWKLKPVDKALGQVLDELGDAAKSADLDALVRATLAKLMER
ncbi:Holliday junction ATP-dependent DNA helicase RuvA [Enhygromyxa salina]|uniref:Holliday junction branch migration complex subunit RuvA n=1 Tax=Enhygromyxa salina TaxID=215803 RepID=A0A2S9YLE9_9BACT|nr:Holliday junction branch migration protein RuvA [Enhygromyxa salina]PRQ05866.1 Holliday junction ATP-dependent DNA helicase RuvA [Enhygromyxa salina]